MDISWIASIIAYFQAHVSTSDLAYVSAAGAALTVVLVFITRIRAIAYEFLVMPVKQFFGRFDSMHKRVAHLEKKLYDADFKKIQDTINHISAQVEELGVSAKTLRRQYKKVEALQKSILNISDIPTFETDEKGKLYFVNKAYTKFLGRTFEEVKDYGWVNIIHPDDRVRVKDEWFSALKEHRNFECSLRVMCRKRRVYRIFCESHPICGESDGYIGHFYNIVLEEILDSEEENP